MNSEDNSEDGCKTYSVRELAEMGLPGYPGTERAWLDRVKSEEWACVEFKGQGRGGIRREYTPPPDVMALIEARKRGEEVKLITYHKTGAGKAGHQGKASSDQAVKGDDSMDVKPTVIEGAALKCPGCGAFTGFIKPEGRVRLEFDVPDHLTFLHVALALKPGYKDEDVDAVLALSYRAFSVLSLVTAGNMDGISNLLSKPKLVNALAVFCEELNANPTHDHLPPDK